MCSPSLSLLAERKYASDSDSDSRECEILFLENENALFFYFTKKRKSIFFFFATTITTNEQHKVVPRVHSYSSFTLPHSLYLFAFVSVYLILISVVTVVELTRSVVRLSEFVYAVIA